MTAVAALITALTGVAALVLDRTSVDEARESAAQSKVTSGGAVAEGRLEASALRELLTGRTIVSLVPGWEMTQRFLANGVTYEGPPSGGPGRFGRWGVREIDRGRYCSSFADRDGGRESCFHVDRYDSDIIWANARTGQKSRYTLETTSANMGAAASAVRCYRVESMVQGQTWPHRFCFAFRDDECDVFHESLHGGPSGDAFLIHSCTRKGAAFRMSRPGRISEIEIQFDDDTVRGNVSDDDGMSGSLQGELEAEA